MKLAYLLPDWPDPPLKGYQRIAYERLRRLSTRYEIDVFFFQQSRKRIAADSVLKTSCNAVHEVRLPYARALLSTLCVAASRTPFQVAYYRSNAMRKLFAEACRRSRYDGIIVQTIRLAQYLPDEYLGVAILDAVDAMPISYMRSLTWRPPYMRWLVREEARRLTIYERHIVRRFSHVTVVSHGDVEEYKALLGSSKVAVVPHAVDAAYFRSSGESRIPGAIVLSGNLGYGPNVDAVNYFCREIFPIVLAEYPTAELFLVGARPARSVKNWARSPNVKVVGPVDDLRPYLARAAVSVCPVRHHVGVQTKILEAMAMGTPVVSTRAGISGLGDHKTIPARIADSPAEFAASVVSLLQGNDWTRLSTEGRAFVEARFSWEASVSALERLLARA